MMNEQKVRELFGLPVWELTHKLYAMMPVEGKISNELFTKYWNLLSEEDKKDIAKQIAELMHIDALAYGKKYPWMGNPYL